MAKILIISGSYFPYATANAVCMKKFEDTLREQGHKIIYCNRKHDLYEPDFHVVDGTEIYTVGKNSDLFFQTVERLRGLPLPNGMQQAFQWAMKGFQVLMKLKNLGKGKSQIRSVARDEYLSSYAKKIQELIEKENIDLIISVSMPFDSHCAVLRALKDWRTAKRPKWLAYCIDAYWSKAGVATAEIPLMKAEEAVSSSA